MNQCSILTEHTFGGTIIASERRLALGGNEAELVIGRLSSAESIAKPTVESWFRFFC